MTQLTETLAHIQAYQKDRKDYPMLDRAAEPLRQPDTPILGRDVSELRRGLHNPEKANVILLGDPGSGKTAYIQGFAFDPDNSAYLTLQVDIERLIKETSGDKDAELANGLMDLVADVQAYSKAHDVLCILFIDEFHRIPMLSGSAVEAMKPILEKSAINGFRIVAATTFEEYDQWINPNRALDQRLLRITLPELGKEAVIDILKSKIAYYGLEDKVDQNVYSEIYDTSRQILMSNSQPRAAIDMLLNVIGSAIHSERMVNGELERIYATPEQLNLPGTKLIARPLLNQVVQRAYGIDIDNQVSVGQLRKVLESNIYNQEGAVHQALTIFESMMVGFNDPTRPKASFLSTGPTGTGKLLSNDTLIPSPSGWLRHGDLKVGDVIFSRTGEPTTVTGTFPHKDHPIYEVTLLDGRKLEAGLEHLWEVYHRQDASDRQTKAVLSTSAILQNGIEQDGWYRYALPMAQAVQYPKKDLLMSPFDYAMTVDVNEPFENTDYLMSDIQDRTELLNGFRHRFGSQDDVNTLVVPIGSDHLVEVIRELVFSLGFRPSCYTVDNTTHVIIHEDVCYAPIISIQYLGKEDAQCIQVDNEEHLYLAGEYVVTHNTEMAKQITSTLGVPLKRFDMSRYSRPEDAQTFADDLCQAAWSAPNAYILIDEVEKSTREAVNILLQVLDDARLAASNNPNRIISFAGTIINLTTNVASEVYDHDKRFGRPGEPLDTSLIYDALKNAKSFETAVLGRLDRIVPFRGLPDEAMFKIAESFLINSLDVVTTKDRTFCLSPDIIPFVVKDNVSRDTENGGARDAKRQLKSLILGPIAHYMAEHPNDERPLIVGVGGTPRFKNPEVGKSHRGYPYLTPCHPHKEVDAWLEAIGQKWGVTLQGEELYIPHDWTIKDFAQIIAPLAQEGHRSFRTLVDGEDIFVVPSQSETSQQTLVVHATEEQ